MSDLRSMILRRAPILVRAVSLIAVIYGIWLYCLARPATDNSLHHSTRVTMPEPKATEVQGSRSTTDRAVITATRDLSVSNSNESKWDGLFIRAADGFTFAQTAIGPALNGSSRAAFYMGKIAERCLPLSPSITGKKPEVAIGELEQTLASKTGLASSDIVEFAARTRKELEFCRKYLEDNPFADAALAANKARDPSYWWKLSKQRGDPLALANDAVMNIDRTIEGGVSNSVALDEIQKEIFSAVESGDAAALFEVGVAMQSSQSKEQPNRPYAAMLASCDLGFDCSSSNPRLSGYIECANIGTCSPGYTLSEWVRANIGEVEFTKAYAQAQEIVSAIRNRDSNALRRTFNLDMSA